MSFVLNHKPEENTIYIKVVGKFDADQYDMIMDQVVSDPNISDHSHTLWELSEMDFSEVHKDFLTDIISHRKKYDKLRGKNTRAAIVAPTDLGFGVSRQYQALSFEFTQKMRIFREMVDAKQWLKEI